MANKTKKKKRLDRTITRRCKEIEKVNIDKAWRSYWVKAGILKE